ncbi:hypothetical protein NXV75_25260 [Bacteroides faecis]|nr:hypothetical protein [Bacteroides faecis]
MIGIIGTSPLWIDGIIGILISDWGPIFYTAHHYRWNNKPFRMYKTLYAENGEGCYRGFFKT